MARRSQLQSNSTTTPTANGGGTPPQKRGRGRPPKSEADSSPSKPARYKGGQSANETRTFRYTGDRKAIDMWGVLFNGDEAVSIPVNRIAYTWKKQAPMNSRDIATMHDVLVVDKLAGHPDFKEIT